MKRYYLVMVILLLSLLLSSCGAKGNTQKSEDSNVASQTTNIVDDSQRDNESIDGNPVAPSEPIIDSGDNGDQRPEESIEPEPEPIDYGMYYDSGSLRYDLYWTLYDSGTLVISGTGNMIDFDYSSSFLGSIEIPWEDYRDLIKSVVIEEGVTSIGNGAFYRCKMLQSVEIPDSMESIHESAFQYCEQLKSITIPSGVKIIERNAFQDCTVLSDISFPETGVVVEYAAFDNCPALEGYQLPEYVNLKSIDEDGTIYEFANQTWIVGQDGTIIASTQEGDFQSIYAYGGGYYILYNYQTGFSANTTDCYILSKEGYVVDSWSWDTETEVSQQLAYDACKLGNKNYCGQSVFLLWATNRGNKYLHAYLDAHYYNCDDTDEFDIKRAYYGEIGGQTLVEGLDDAGSYLVSFTEAIPYDYIHYYNIPSGLSYSSWCTYVVSKDGIEFDLGSNVISMGDYSDGGFIFAEYEDGWHQEDFQLRFLDCTSWNITDICSDSDKINLKDVKYFKFIDGESEIKLTGSDGNIYTAIIDKLGNYVEEPHL